MKSAFLLQTFLIYSSFLFSSLSAETNFPKSFDPVFDCSVSLSQSDLESVIPFCLPEKGSLWKEGVEEKLAQSLCSAWTSNPSNLDDPNWLLRLRFAQIIHSLHSSKSDTDKTISPEACKSVLSNPTLLDLLGRFITPQDNLSSVLSILSNLVNERAEKTQDFPALAVALALVYDQPLPKFWPHHQVNSNQVPLLDTPTPWLDLIDYFTTPPLDGTIKKQSVDDLIFVVDCPVKISELEWARKNVRISRSEFARAYSMVRYDQERIEKQPIKYKWPHSEDYTLENIKELGGICVDQSYFATIAAKANGVPSIAISGGGRTSAHAWFGYMPRADSWNMQAGRYPGEGFVVGECLHPQKWEIINDHQLAYVSQRFTSTPEYWRSNALLTLSQINSALSPENKESILVEARSQCQKNPAAWMALEQLWKKLENTEKLSQLYTEMLKQFQRQPDIVSDVRTKLANLSNPQTDDSESDPTLNELIRKNRDGRSDLVLKGASEMIEEKLKKNNYNGVVQSAKLLYKAIGKEGGTDLASWTHWICQTCIDNNSPQSAKEIFQTAKKSIAVSGPSAINQVADILQRTDLMVEIAMTESVFKANEKDNNWDPVFDQLRNLISAEKALQETEQQNRKETVTINHTTAIYEKILESLIKNQEKSKASQLLSSLRFRKDVKLEEKFNPLVNDL